MFVKSDKIRPFVFWICIGLFLALIFLEPVMGYFALGKRVAQCTQEGDCGCFIVGFYLLPVALCAGVAIFVIWAITKKEEPPAPLSEEEQTRRAIEDRKKLAKEKKIREKAREIITYLGRYPLYSDDILKISIAFRDERTTIEHLKDAQAEVVFECTYEEAERTTSVEKRLKLETNDRGDLFFKPNEVLSEHVTPSRLEIIIYKPGDWEIHFEQLAERAKAEGEIRWQQSRAQKEEEEQRRRKEELDREKERFGL